MWTLRLVLVDLWHFVKAELLGTAPAADQSISSTPLVDSQRALLVPPPLPASDATPEVNPASHAPTTVDLVAGQKVFIMFPETPCYLRPALVRDTVLGTFSYASQVKVIAEQGDWVHVAGDELEGWTERSHVTPERTDVLPVFVPDQIYDADHPETLKLRTYINDEFGIAFMHIPALNCEYVWFQMEQQQKAFSWPPLRPRTPGRWSEILRPEPSVHISSIPLTSSIMEYVDEQRIAELYYVEAVTPEEAVTVSGFTGADIGAFVRMTFTKDEWTSLHPRYIIKK